MNGKDAKFDLETEIIDFERNELQDEQLILMANSLNIGLVLHDIIYDDEDNPIDLRPKDMNGIYEKITRRNKKEFIGQFFSSVYPTRSNDWLEKYKPAILAQKVITFENFDHGLRKWFSITAYSPNSTRLALMLVDISDRKNAEIALIKSEAENKIIIDNLQIGIFVHDGLGRVITYNTAASKMLGVELDHLVEKDLEYPKYKFVHEDGRTPLKIAEYPVSLVMATKKPLSNLFFGIYKENNPEISWVKCSASPIIDEHKNIEKIIVSLVDMTKQKNLEERILEDAKEIMNQKIQIEATLVSIGDGVIATDKLGMINVFNSVAEQLTGWGKEEAIGRPFEDVFCIIRSSTRKKIENIIKKVIKTSQPLEIKGDTILLSRDGKEYYIENSATPIKTNNNGVIGAVLVFRDITDKVLLSKKLVLESQRLSQVVNVAVDIIFELDRDMKITYYSGPGFSKLGFNKSQIMGKKIDAIFRDNLAIQNFAFMRAIDGLQYKYDSNINKGNKNLWFENTLSPLYDDKEKIVGVLGICRDITDRKQGQKEIEYLSKHDFLTGLHNRHFFGSEVEKINIESNYPLGIVMADLNGLKIFNDVFGHDMGDSALQTVSRVLKSFVGSQDIVARIGGDEFAMVFTRTNKEKMKNIYLQILKEISQKEINGLPISLAIGYEIKNDTLGDIQETMKVAESRMYLLKLTQSMEFRNDAVIKIITLLNNKHSQLKKNSEIVSDLSRKIGEALNLEEDVIKELAQTGLLHNIGKVFISDEILQKPGKLTAEEYQIVKLHSEKGYQILKVADKYSHLADFVLYHHEACNGSGYPRGLKGINIPLVSRIIHIADAYEAMTSDRLYRHKVDSKEAARELLRCSEKEFDLQVVQVFVEKILGFTISEL